MALADRPQRQPALPGTLTLPAGPGPFPGVVLVHGSGPQDRDETIGGSKLFRDLAWGLAAKGIVVLRYEPASTALIASAPASYWFSWMRYDMVAASKAVRVPMLWLTSRRGRPGSDPRRG